MYTVSKAEFSVFFTWSDLGSEKHRTQAEIDDAVKVVNDILDQFGAEVASIAVDNAARSVAKAVCDKFPGMNIMLLRDPGHCIDLLSKDLLMGDEYIDFQELSQIDKT